MVTRLSPDYMFTSLPTCARSTAIQSFATVFRKTFEERLKAALDDAHVPSRQLWFMDTSRGDSLNKDRKNSTLGNVTFVSVGKSINDNAREDLAFGPTHRLIVFPTSTFTSGALASLELKWDVRDAKTGNYEWSVYARTPNLGPSMSADAAADAARTLVDAVVHEMRAKGVLGAQ